MMKNEDEEDVSEFKRLWLLGRLPDSATLFHQGPTAEDRQAICQTLQLFRQDISKRTYRA